MTFGEDAWHNEETKQGRRIMSDTFVVMHPANGKFLEKHPGFDQSRLSIISCPDDLSYGPIATVQTADRLSFVEEMLGFETHSEEHRRIEDFWRQLGGLDLGKTVFWCDTSSAREQCNFMECLFRINAQVKSVCMPNDRELYASQREVLLTNEEVEKQMSLWTQLKMENSPLRIIEDGVIKSVPLDHFDQNIMSHLTDDWQRSDVVIANALSDIYNDNTKNGSGQLLWSRIIVLVESSSIDHDGTLDSMSDCRIRALHE